MTHPPILEIRHLTKSYGGVPAVDDISFDIEAGSCFGILGPNGAGKTTTLEILENIFPPDGGQIRFQGRPRGRDFNARVGVQFQQTELLAYLTVEETLKTFAAFYDHSRPVSEMLSQCLLERIRHQDHQTLSGGQRQRLLLALALIHDPDLIFLDEPSTGLDPQARRQVWEIVDGVRAGGKTVVLTTHYMDEAQTLCDRVAIMDEGKIVALDTPEQLIREHCPDGGGQTNLETVFLTLTGKQLVE